MTRYAKEELLTRRTSSVSESPTKGHKNQDDYADDGSYYKREKCNDIDGGIYF
jgi:hypothetical protein